MQVVRTILWILLFVGLLAFSFFNWKPVEVTIWDNLVLETKVPALVIVSFLLGMVPTWMLHRGTKWRMGRRIKTLENAAKAAAVTPSTTPATTPTTTAATPTTRTIEPAPRPSTAPEPKSPFTSEDTGKP